MSAEQKLPVLTALFVAIAVVCSASQVAIGFDEFDRVSGEISREAMRSQNLSDEQVAELERQVEEDPTDLDSRTKLLGYYFSARRRDASLNRARDEHILWLIEHSPEAPVLGEPYGMIGTAGLSPRAAEAVELWEKQIETHSDSLWVLHNAARSFVHTNRPRAIELLERASELDPDNPRWHGRLGQMHKLDVRSGDRPVDKQAAVRALDAFETALAGTTEIIWRQSLLADIAEVAMYAEEYDRAVRSAREMLQIDAEMDPRMSGGQAVYDGNMVLGQVAFARGDLDGAGRYLVRAGRTSGSPSLGSFGPGMLLARDLLEAGHPEPVIAYLKECGRFWHRETTDQWIAEIEAGEIPDFGRNLR